MVVDPFSRPRDRGGVSALSPREREVLEMAALGLTNRQVALQLNVTIHAVKFHLASIYRKLGVMNRTEAAATYIRATAPPSPASPPGGIG